MKLRIIILILAVFAFLSVSTGGWLYYYSYREAAFEKAEADADYKLTLLTGQLSAKLSEHIKPVKALAGIKELVQALEETDLETIYRANRILDHFTASMDLDVSYLLDLNGVTLCSSNRNAADSFVGKDFSFRPYYQDALTGQVATYLALGAMTSKRGVYYSYPVHGSREKGIIGVAVIKSSVEFLEESLLADSSDILLLTDPNGLIFMSSRPELRFRLLWYLEEEAAFSIADSKQFGNGPWQWSGFKQGADGRILDPAGEEYLMSVLEVTNYPGWKMVSLRAKKELQKQVSGPFIRVIGPVAIFISTMAGLLVLILYQMAAQELTRRRHAEKQLKISEQRYRSIYHKTPVMLHSIDTQGNIIHVSDHWVEVMGYQREAVIGQPLTKFFTPESEQFAKTQIFPRFFSTGFCKDIPYTYVKQNGERMETLLSCYGVRNDKGEITRSLAVSVDVTEKNRVQEDLEKAKEKLSTYSLDLEKQVHRRTSQLEKAQASLKELSKKIIASQEREKEAVARELHDHLGQVLTAMRIDTVWMEKFLTPIDQKAKERVKKMTTLIDTTIQDVRDMAYRLRPRVLDDLGLTDALESLVSDFERRTNVSCIFLHEVVPEIDKTLATALYRIGQEAVTNSVRHSRAGSIVVALRMDSGRIVLSVEDDGCGFLLDEKDSFSGFGLESMRERANLVGGEFSIDSQPGKGTRVYCRVKVGK